jgi:cysteine desulfurase
LRDRLWEGLAALYPAAVRNGAWESPGLQLANTLNVSFPGLDGETLLIQCDLAGICVSGGSACMAGATQPSHVLLAMGRPLETARASLRFSLGKGTAEAEIDAALERMAKILARR